MRVDGIEWCGRRLRPIVAQCSGICCGKAGFQVEFVAGDKFMLQIDSCGCMICVWLIVEGLKI